MFTDVLYEDSLLNKLKPSESQSVIDSFVYNRWVTLSDSERRNVLQQLENICAAEQGRPAKLLVFRPMEGGLCGCWNEATDTISINSNLVDHGGYSYKGTMIPMSDSVMQLYDTVLHEGYHAYQSYAIAHPEVHADKAQLAQWTANNAMGPVSAPQESNYYVSSEHPDLYRIQALERDAFEYAEKNTRECFDAIEAREGPQPGYEEYKHSCSINSYENALASEQAKDPAILSHMDEEMLYREAMWQQGYSCGPIGQGNYHSLSQAPQMQHFAAPDAAFNPDEGEAVHVLGLGYSTAYSPSVSEQYLDGVQGLNEQYSGRFQDPQQMQQYNQELAALQQSLGNFDPRTSPAICSAYEDMDAVFREYMDERIENADLEDLKQLKENYDQLYQQYVIDASGYHEYMGPSQQQLYEQFQQVDISDMASYASEYHESSQEALPYENNELISSAENESMDMYLSMLQNAETKANAENEAEDMSFYAAAGSPLSPKEQQAESQEQSIPQNSEDTGKSSGENEAYDNAYSM